MRKSGKGPSPHPTSSTAEDALHQLELALLSLRGDLDKRMLRRRRTDWPHGQLDASPDAAPAQTLRFRPIAAVDHASPRLRFTPMRRRTDRVLLTNWDSQVGRICVGDVEVELAPGQSTAVWIDCADPGPYVTDEAEPSPCESAVLFTDGPEAII